MIISTQVHTGSHFVEKEVCEVSVGLILDIFEGPIRAMKCYEPNQRVWYQDAIPGSRPGEVSI